MTDQCIPTRGPGSLETWTPEQLAAWLQTYEARRLGERLQRDFEERQIEKQLAALVRESF